MLKAGASLVSLILTAIRAPQVIAIAWLWYRPLVSIIVLAVGLAAAYGFKSWAASKAADEGRPAAIRLQPNAPAAADSRALPLPQHQRADDDEIDRVGADARRERHRVGAEMS